MIHVKSRNFIAFAFVFIMINLILPTSTCNLIQTEETNQTLEAISFDKYCRTDQEGTHYKSRFNTETTSDNNSTMLTEIYKVETRYSNIYNSNDVVNSISINLYNDGLMDSCWPMKSQNRRHSGLSLYNTIGNNGMVKWTYETEDWIEGGIAIDINGVLYFGDFNYYLYAMYPDGTLKWQYKTDGWIWSTPALAADGTIFVGTYGNYLYAINPNGTLKWKFWAGSAASISSSPAIADDGTIIFGAMGPNPDSGEESGRIYALYPNGTEKWHYDTDYWIVSDPAIADDGTIYIGSGDSYLYALNSNGSLRWRFKTGDIVKSHPSIGKDGTIYFDSFDDHLYALNPDGTLKWKYKGVISGSAGPAIDENGIVYIGGKRLSAFYPNGTIKWEYTFGDDKRTGHSSPAISADETIYIGVTKGDSSGGYIYAVDSEGILRWQQKISNDECPSSPSISEDGTVYIGSSAHYKIDGEPYGVLYAFGRNEVNQAPDPPVISGTDVGRVNISYLYNFTVHDPELDDIELLLDWGDGNSTNWLGPYDSDTVISINHAWSEKGTFELRAKARDTYDGSESDWSAQSVTMPKAKLGFVFLQHLRDFFDLIMDYSQVDFQFLQSIV